MEIVDEQENLEKGASGAAPDHQDPAQEEEEEGESVYMIDGVVMRMIQIEGEDQQSLMDP